MPFLICGTTVDIATEHHSIIFDMLLRIALFSAALLLCSPRLAVSQIDSNLSITGVVDAFYANSINGGETDVIAPFLYNHNRHNEFGVNLAMLSAKYVTDNARATLSLHTGSYLQDNYAAEPIGYKHIYEAYAGIALTEGLWLDAGVFSSHLGAESAISKDNWTLTRSLYAENNPYFETGARLSYTPNTQWSLTGFVLNGWQNISDANQSKAIGTQIQFKPVEELLINSSSFYGNERADSLPQNRFFHDLYLTYQATDALGIQAVFDYGTEETITAESNSWYAVTGIVRYKLSEKFVAAVRGEHYNDENGVIIATGTPAGFQVTGFSANLDYWASPNAVLRIEGKSYNSKNDIFVKGDEPANSLPIVTTSICISF